MERVYLDKEEFQELLNNGFKAVRWTVIKDRKQTDPELVGLRVFEYAGIQYVEKEEFKG